MRIPTVADDHRIAVYNHFFIEGTLTAAVNFDGAHHELEHIPNIEVIQAMKTLLAYEMIYEYQDRANFNWDINDKGIEFLRALLRPHYTVIPKTVQSRTSIRRLYYFYLNNDLID